MKAYLLIVPLFILGGLKATAQPELRKRISFETYENVISSREDCLDYAILKYQRGKEAEHTHKLCGAGGNPRFVGGRDDTFVFVNIIGGNAAGWGLYRYQESIDEVVSYDFDARKIYFEDRNKYQEKDGVWLEVHYAVHNPKGGGYLPDRIEHWYWPFNSQTPVRE